MKNWAVLMVVVCMLMAACGPQEDYAARNGDGSESASTTAQRAKTPVAIGAEATPTIDPAECTEALVNGDGTVVPPDCATIPFDPLDNEGYEGTGEEVNEVDPTNTPDLRPPCKPGARPKSQHLVVEGCVTDPSGRPIVNASVSPLNTGPGTPTAAGGSPPTDARGHYSRGLFPGPWDITVEAKGYKTVTKHIMITDKPVVLDFVLEPVEK